MSNFQDLNDDVIKLIFQYVYYLQFIELRECCHLFNRNINKFYIKTKFMNNIFMAIHLKYVMMEDKSLDDLLYPSSFDNSWNTMKCCNDDCRNITNIALGVSYFYYPKDLTYINIDPDPYAINLSNYYRTYECINSPYIKRHIPYCCMCMRKYVNFQEREDLQEVPYGTVYGAIES